MSFFEKFLDFIQPTKAQLRSMLVGSVGIIGSVYFIGVKVAGYQTTFTETNQITKENTVMIKEIKSNIDNLRLENKENIDALYLDILDMNARNNSFMNTKFNLLIDYGNSNKGLLKDMLKVQDEQQKLYEDQKLKNKDYLNPPYKSDTTKLSIGVKKAN